MTSCEHLLSQVAALPEECIPSTLGPWLYQQLLVVAYAHLWHLHRLK